MTRQFFRTDDSGWGQIEPLAAHSVFGYDAERLGGVGEEVGPRDLALHQHGLTDPLPSDDVWDFTRSAVLLGKDNSALVMAAKPGDGMHHQARMMGYKWT